MCLIVFAFKQHPTYDVILAANRDEAYARPTRAAQLWGNGPNILAGKDLQAGGTWMGINRRGQWAALTNYRDPSINKENPPSRGSIVLNYLKQKEGAPSFFKTLDDHADQYNGFNVLAGTPEQIYHYSNQEQKINPVAPGIHGLSNHLLDTPWPKVRRSKAALQELIEHKNVGPDTLFSLLKDDQPADDKNLPDTGIPHKLEKQVSPIFIKSNDYGTRCSTILLIDTKGKVTFEERRFVPGTIEVDETSRFEFETEEQ